MSKCIQVDLGFTSDRDKDVQSQAVVGAVVWCGVVWVGAK